MIVLEITVDGTLGMAAFLGNSGRIFLLKEGLSDNGALVGDGGAHIVEGPGMGQGTVMLNFITSPGQGSPCMSSQGDEPQIPRGEKAALLKGLPHHPGHSLL